MRSSEPLVAQTLYGRHLAPLALRGEDETRVDGLTVQQDGARAALAVPAPDLGSRQAEVLPEQLDQSGRGRNLRPSRFSVDGQE